jgi:hypothetical protein
MSSPHHQNPFASVLEKRVRKRSSIGSLFDTRLAQKQQLRSKRRLSSRPTQDYSTDNINKNSTSSSSSMDFILLFSLLFSPILKKRERERERESWRERERERERRSVRVGVCVEVSKCVCETVIEFLKIKEIENFSQRQQRKKMSRPSSLQENAKAPFLNLSKRGKLKDRLVALDDGAARVSVVS